MNYAQEANIGANWSWSGEVLYNLYTFDICINCNIEQFDRRERSGLS